MIRKYMIIMKNPKYHWRYADYHGGNPNKYRGYDLSWTMGRILAGVDQGDRQIEYGYDHSGVRHSKTVDDVKTEYLLNGTTILQQKTGGDVLRFYYGSDASLLEIGYINESAQDKTEKHFVVIKNVMGDVVALTTPEGILVGSYEYDPYGRILSEKSTDADIYGITKMNPFRYRSYYYDQETGWYYLNSRYYDPEVKRFINADEVSYLGTRGIIGGYNLFTYCLNNPEVYKDNKGNVCVPSILFLSIVIGVSVLTSACGVAIIPDDGEYKEVKGGGSTQNCYTYAVGVTCCCDPGEISNKCVAGNFSDAKAVGKAVEEDMKYLGRSIRPLNDVNDSIDENEFMIALRVGKKPLMKTQNGTIYGYHFMKRLKNGQWVEKNGTAGDSVLHDIGENPENLDWRIELYPGYIYDYDDPNILYYAISYEAIK